MSRKHVFGDNQQWAIDEDDGCLRFYPQWSIDESKTAVHIWREAWAEVQRLGGFDAAVAFLRSKPDESDATA